MVEIRGDETANNRKGGCVSQDQIIIKDLALLCRRLMKHLPNTPAAAAVKDQARDYLKRNKLDGNPLREDDDE